MVLLVENGARYAISAELETVTLAGHNRRDLLPYLKLLIENSL